MCVNSVNQITFVTKFIDQTSELLIIKASATYMLSGKQNYCEITMDRVPFQLNTSHQ